MLNKVRSSMQSGFTYVLVAGLTVIFMFFFGMPTQTCAGGAGRGRALLANVSGDEVYTDDVNLIYNRVYGTDRTDEEDKYLRRRATSLRSMILIKLFAQRAQNEGLRVSDKEFKQYIKDAGRNIEYRYRYGQDGSFNGHYYKAYVQNQLRATIEEYENFKRQELLARKYLATQAAQIAPSTAELRDAHKIKNTKLNLSFVSLSNKSLEDSVEVTDEDLQSFVDAKSSRIQKYYEDNQGEFSEPAKLRIRRVYIIKPGKSAEKADKKKVDQKWKEAKRRVLEKGESVGKVAEELGESYPGQEKGLMDWSTVDNMDQNIVDALEGAEVGDVEKVETDHAYMLVKLEGRKKKKTTPLEDVQTEIAKTLIKKERVDALVQEATDTLMKKASETGSLEKALEKLKAQSDKKVWKQLGVEETGEFTLESQGPPPQLAARFGGQLPNMGGSWTKIPKIGDSKELAVDAYKKLSEKNPVPDKVYNVGDSKYIVRLKSRQEPNEDDEIPTELQFSLADKKVSEVLGRWSAMFGSWGGRFVPPMNSYGPWIDKQLSEAVDSEVVSLYAKRSKVAATLNQDFQPGGGAPAPGGSAKKKGSPIKIGGGEGKKGKGKTIKIGGGKGKKGKGKTIEIGGGEGEKGGGEGESNE